MEERKRIGCMVRGVFILVFMLVVFNGKVSVCAAASEESMIGVQYDTSEGGYAITGLSVKVDGEYIGSYYRKVRHEGEFWKQYSVTLNGHTTTNSYSESDNSYVGFKSGSAYIDIDKISQKLPQRYSIVMSLYQKGQLLKKYIEYSDNYVDGNMPEKYSVKQVISEGESKLNLYSDPGDGYSYVYEIVSPLELGGSDVRIDVKDIDEVQNAGYAYYNGEKYIIHTLPAIDRYIEGWTSEFCGWFATDDFSVAVYTGSPVKRDSTLFAKWKSRINSYEVTCIDILGFNSTGTELGRSSWDAEYGSVAYGSSLGNVSVRDAYYIGRCYKGCSAATVGTSGCTVYRFFGNGKCTVDIVDCVSSGAAIGIELGRRTDYLDYSTYINGSVAGTDKEYGAYYKGYKYTSCSSSIVNSDCCTVYRYFQPAVYGIRFVENGATDGNMSDSYYCYGETDVLPDNLYSKHISVTLDLNSDDAVCDKELLDIDCSFAGWSVVANGDVIYKDCELIKNLADAEKTLDLYAKWGDESIFVDEKPTRDGYEFMGWSIDRDDIQGDNEFTVSDNTVLYAVWKPLEVNYAVECYKEQIDGKYILDKEYAASELTDTQLSSGDVAETFEGFSLDEETKKEVYTVKGDGSLVVKLYYRRNTYKISYELNDGIGDKEHFTGKNAMFGDFIIIDRTEPVKAGYEFVGWDTDAGAEDVKYRAGDELCIESDDIVLYAVWKAKSNVNYSVNIYLEDQNGNGYNQVDQITFSGVAGACVYDELCKHLESIQYMEHYIIGDADELKSKKIDGDGSTVTKLYLDRKQYTVSYIDSAPNASIIEKHTVPYGDTYIVGDMTEEIDTSTYRDQNGTIYSAGNQICVESDVKLYPQCKVHWISNVSSDSDISEYVDYGISIRIPDIARSGYDFKGWYLDSGFGQYAGNSGGVIYDITCDSTYYAKWSEPLKYNVTLDTSKYSGTVILEGDVSEYHYMDTIVLPTENQMVIPDGYIFKGWKIEGENEIITKISAGEAGDKKLVLVLEQKQNSSSNKNQPDSDNSSSCITTEQSNTPNNLLTDTSGISTDTSGASTDTSGASTDTSGLSTDTSDISSDSSNTMQNDQNASDTLNMSGGNDISEKKENSVALKQSVKGKKYMFKGITYIVVKDSDADRKVSVVSVKRKVVTCVIPASISINGTKYKVVSIAAGAFKDRTKLRKVTLGKNIQTIGKKAFYNDKKLSKLNIKSNLLKAVGAKAFKGVNRRCKVKIYHTNAVSKKLVRKYNFTRVK